MKAPEHCRALIPNPDGEGQVRCGNIAEEQCQVCLEYFCHDDETHLIVCHRCGAKHCEPCHAKHMTSRECLEVA